MMIPMKSRTNLEKKSEIKSPAIKTLKALVLVPMAVIASTGVSLALPPTTSPELAPHRAVYEMKLGEADENSGIIAVKGRMVFEFQGNHCDGYTQNMRFVTEITDKRGTSTLTDLRTSNWEDGAGARFRFNSQHYRDRNLKEIIKGDAKRDSKMSAVNVALFKPSKQKLTLKDQVFFPNQHSVELLKSAMAGKTILQARIYDGSEKGRKVFNTTSIIGKEGVSNKPSPFPNVANAERLEGVASWPVAISYFEDGTASGEELPVYELAFRFYANGVSRNLLINYGDFTIRGILKEIEFYKLDACTDSAKN